MISHEVLLSDIPYKAFCIPFAENKCIGMIITYTKVNTPMVYYNTFLRPKSEILNELKSLLPNITIEEEIIPPEIVEWAKKVVLITKGQDQDTSSIPIDMRGYTEKQRLVISVAHTKIPVNEVYSYGEVAALAGLPAAHRFVGTTMRTCRQPWIIACQRVKSGEWVKKQKKGPNYRQSLI